MKYKCPIEESGWKTFWGRVLELTFASLVLTGVWEGAMSFFGSYWISLAVFVSLCYIILYKLT